MPSGQAKALSKKDDKNVNKFLGFIKQIKYRLFQKHGDNAPPCSPEQAAQYLMSVAKKTGQANNILNGVRSRQRQRISI